ncbi:MAG: ABC transporter permease [Myxococcaceae bacterium]|nr:ABC transporter permease [Myxococcaceae bacterium]
MAELRDDLRFAVRILRKSPGFTVVAIFTLALAIGVNTALFSVVNGVLLRSLPFPEPERLFYMVRRDPAGGAGPFSVPQLVFLSGQAQPFSQLAAWPTMNSGFNLSGAGLPERVLGGRVTQSFFEVLGTSPALGRGFMPQEDVPGGPRVVVLGHGLWQRRFGGSPQVLGKSLTLNGEAYTIVGVAPPGFQYPEHAQLWIPLQLDLASTENAYFLSVVGRLKPEAEPGQVASLVKAQGEQLRASRPAAVPAGHWWDASELQSQGVQKVRPALLMLLGAVVAVLLIACVNLANLQLARAAARGRELAMRTALGASPGRIARQLLTESVLLSGMGGVLGLVLAGWMLPMLLALVPREVPRLEEVHIDGSVLVFTLSVSVLTGLLFGLLPAWHATQLDPRGFQQVTSSRATSGPAGSRTRRLLVVSEVALAVILLISAALLVKSFVLLRGVSPGIDPEGVLTMKLSLPEKRYGNPEAYGAFVQRVLERGRALPGAEAVGFALSLPFETGARQDIVIQQYERGEVISERVGEVLYRPVTGGYFPALKIELVRGRLVDDLDKQGSAPVAVINEAAARRYWPGQDPIGARILLGREIAPYGDPAPREIIGVVRDVLEGGLEEEPPAIVYIPLGQMPAPYLTMAVRLVSQSLVVRAAEADELLATAVLREIHAVDAQQPVTDVVSMEEIVSRALGPQRFSTLLLGLMAGLALVLAAVGIYGVLSYLVNQRTQELGVRLALGATPRQVVWLVLRQGMAPVLVGVTLGVAGAFGLTRLLSHLLYEVSTKDPMVFLVAPGGLLAVALVATWLPAYRASRVDPLVALRAE